MNDCSSNYMGLNYLAIIAFVLNLWSHYKETKKKLESYYYF